MSLFEGKTPAERNKIIAAIALGALSLIAIVFVFFGDSLFGSSKAGTQGSHPSPSPVKSPAANTGASQTTAANDASAQTMGAMVAVSYSPVAPPDPAIGRNIFSFYVPPPPTPEKVIPATPTPTPPILLSGLSPANVFAQTADFMLTVSGDKFTPDSKIIFDNTPLQTRFISPQQMQASVPAAMIANDGPRQIMVRATDPKMFSNQASLVVAAPPKPNYDYVALIGDRHYQNDVAMLKSRSNAKELISVQRGDLVSGRFRITSISEAEVAMVDTSLNIKHTIEFSSDKNGGASGRNGAGAGAGDENDIRRFPKGRLQPDPNTQSIPGIPDSIPRYQPPNPQSNKDDDEDDDGKP
jgi:hypothetical protein